MFFKPDSFPQSYLMSCFIWQEARLAQTAQTNTSLKSELASTLDQLAKEQASLNAMRLERDEKDHDLKMARLNLDAQVAESTNLDKEKSAHVKAIRELRASQAHLIKEKDTAQNQLADRNREMTGLR